jgi:GMP synthase PP-ATPase subunit
MYQAFNDNIIVSIVHNPILQKTVLDAEVLATCDHTAKLQGKTIYADRRFFNELSEMEDVDTKTSSGIILGNKKSYASLDIKHVLAVKE